MSADRKLFKTIDKHLDQILEDTQLSHSLERERKNSINSLFGSSASPPASGPGTRRGSYISERDRRSSSSSINFRRGSMTNNPNNNTNEVSNLSKSLNGSGGDTSYDEYAIDESPFGPLKNSTTRKTFAYLIAILNTTYPDHDFSNLQPSTENFHKLNSPEELIHKFNNVMISLGKKEDLLNWIWDTVNSYMDIIPPKGATTTGGSGNGSSSRVNSVSSYNTPLTPADSPPSGNNNSFEGCQIYEFQPTDQSILEDLNYPYQSMWSYYWFIYNKKKKRVSFLYLNAINKIHYSMVNSKRTSSSSRRNDDRNGGESNGTHGGEDDDEDDDDEMYMDDYMEEEVMMDDDDDMDDDVVGGLEI